MRRRFLPLFLACLMLASTAIEGSGETGDIAAEYPRVFLPDSFFSPFSPTGKYLVFDASVNVPFFMWNGMRDVEWRKDGGFTWTAMAMTNFDVRMFRGFSSPVRTPSYRVGGLFQILHLAKHEKDDVEDFRLTGLNFGFMHYSNGQSGCTFLGYEILPVNGKPECVQTGSDVLASRANTKDGSFSSHYLPVEFWVRFGALENDEAVRSLTVGLKAEFHLVDSFGGSMSSKLADAYGSTRLGLQIEAERRFRATVSDDAPLPESPPWTDGILRFRTEGFAFLGRDDGTATGAEFELSYIIRRLGNFGPFVRVHLGPDPYNIHFENEDPYLQFGVVWDLGRLDTFRPTSSE